MEFKDYYATLGVAKTASEKEIKQAFRKLARKHHPDVNPGDKAAEAKFKEINEAYEVLGDPEKRKKYDELGANWRMYEQAARRRWRRSVRRCLERQRRRRAGRRRFRTMTQEEMEEMFGGRRARSPTSSPRSSAAAAAEACGKRGARPRAAARRPRRRARDRADARGRVPRHDAAAGAQARRPGPHRRRADSCRRRRRLARSRRRRGRARRAAPRRATCICGSGWRRIPVFERKGRDLYVKVPLPVTTRPCSAARRRSRRSPAGRRGCDSAAHAERPGVPAEGLRDAGGRQGRRERATCTRVSTSSCRRSCPLRSARTTKRWPS